MSLNVHIKLSTYLTHDRVFKVLKNRIFRKEDGQSLSPNRTLYNIITKWLMVKKNANKLIY